MSGLLSTSKLQWLHLVYRVFIGGRRLWLLKLASSRGLRIAFDYAFQGY